MTKIAGSGSGSISQRHGSADPDLDLYPLQNVMDPQHWLKVLSILFESIIEIRYPLGKELSRRLFYYCTIKANIEFFSRGIISGKS